MFSQVITDRMMEIVTGQLEAVMDTAAREVEDMMAEDAEDSLDFVWTDTAADLGAVWGKGRVEKMGLRMKCWGWAARVQEVWRALDSQLARLLGDQTAAVEQSITEHQQQLLAAWLSDQLD